MPAQQLQLTAFVLARQPSGSDAFEQLRLFSAAHGLLTCLARHVRSGSSGRRPSASQSAGRLDLFDEAECWLESSNQGRSWFLQEHRLIARPEGLGRSYEALQCASALATLLLRNPAPDESREPLAALLGQTFAALASGARPDLVWLKTLFCFLRDEGYPVKQHWWQGLPATERDLAVQILNRPLAEQTAPATAVSRLSRSLEDWLRTETELRL